MEIKKTDMKVVDKMQLNPVKTDTLNDGKQIIGSTPRFKTVYFNFDVGKGLPDHVHNGYASIFIKDGKVDMEFESGEKFVLDKGDYLAFDARVKHNVTAVVKSQVIVNICGV